MGDGFTDADIAAEIRELQRRLEELRSRVDSRSSLEELPPGDIDLLLCRAIGSRFGLPLHTVDEVVAMVELTPVPEAPAWFPGLLDLGGTTVPVIDVTARILRQNRAVTADDFVVVCTVAGRPIGFVVQEIFDVERADRSSLIPPERDMPHAPYLLGSLHLDGGQVLLLSAERLVAFSDLPETDA